MEEEQGGGGAIFKDIRRYFCEYCGICRSKKSLITSHILAHHPEALNNEGKEEEGVSSNQISVSKCDFEECLHTFSTKSNLRQHIKAVHEELRPYACSFGCGMKFSYKHVRDNHEKSGCHVYTPGDFLESDKLFQSRPRGGRKRTCPTVEMLIRKRVTPPQMNTMVVHDRYDD
ncbi:hypothetical protein V6N12_070165 [Hibiscus sabdariffa]|uniref:C2H2-type domain-containing protein n=1 Tax=Hibiscus sabdariffa TaxID=183260 RepID=A0ABR2FGH4_9ROSI